jgi:hypothetical protein
MRNPHAQGTAVDSPGSAFVGLPSPGSTLSGTRLVRRRPECAGCAARSAPAPLRIANPERQVRPRGGARRTPAGTPPSSLLLPAAIRATPAASTPWQLAQPAPRNRVSPRGMRSWASREPTAPAQRRRARGGRKQAGRGTGRSPRLRAREVRAPDAGGRREAQRSGPKRPPASRPATGSRPQPRLWGGEPQPEEMRGPGPVLFHLATGVPHPLQERAGQERLTAGNEEMDRP